MYVGSDAPLIDNISLLSPIFADGGDIENENNENLISTISTNSSFYETPTLITDLYTSSYNSSEQKITGCPFYFNPNGYMHKNDKKFIKK